jgi:hypothetical protein
MMMLGEIEYDQLENRSRYPQKVRIREPGVSQILAPATNNSKLTTPDQPRWVAGRWHGMWMYTVYLEELETCRDNACPPDVKRMCFAHWTPFATRWTWCPTFLPALDENLEEAEHEFREGFTVDLHSSGDFPDLDYVEGWIERLDRFPALHIWGNTAHRRESPIGRLIDRLNRIRRDRVAIRFSGASGDMSSRILGVTIEPEAATGLFVCPANEHHPKANCSTCAFCIDSTDGFVRLEHKKRPKALSAG